jgi:flagellar FliL protein
MFGAKKNKQAVEPANESGKQKGKKEKKGIKRIVILALAAVVVAAAAGAAYCYFSGQIPYVFSESRQAEGKEKKTMVTNLGDVVVNLSDFGSSRYLRLSVVLEYSENIKLEEEIKVKQHKIRDALIDLLRRKTTADVQEPENIETLKRQILDKINEQLAAGKIDSVYFTDFLFQ